MNCTNDKLNYAGPLDLSINENAVGTENVFLEMMDASRVTSSDMNEIPAQLEEILKNVYDLNPTEKDFNPGMNSTLGTNDARLFDPHSNSAGNDFTLNFSGDPSSIYVSASNDISSVSSSDYFTPTMQSSQATYQTNPQFFYRPDNENYVEYMFEQKAYNNMPVVQNNQVDDNDSSPVYLNFNIQNMAQSVQTFNTEFEKYTHQQSNVAGGEKRNNNEISYVEYMNNIEEAWQPQLVEIQNAQRSQIFRPIQTNIMPTSMKKFPMQKVYSFPQDIEKLNGAYATAEILSSFQPLNNNILTTNYTEPQRPSTVSVQRQVVVRNPLQTRLSVKIYNSEWNVMNEKNTDSKSDMPSEQYADAELLAIDQTDPEIPFIKERPSTQRKRRKQWLTSLMDNDISFMNANGEFSKFEPTNDVAEKDFVPPINTSYVTLRKKPKILSSAEASESLSSAGRSKHSPKQMKRESIANDLLSCSAITVSSDSDSEYNSESQDAKCLKCDRCKKMFKTPRSYSIHRKRCNAPQNSDSTYVLEVEYLESEKEDDYEEVAETESKDIKYCEQVEIIESDSIESIDILKEEILDEEPVEKHNEHLIRRNTRSCSGKSSSISTTSSSLSTCDSPNKSVSRKSSKKNSTSSVDIKQTNRCILSCHVCGKKFRQKSYLIAHKRIHEKNFKCQYCNKSFMIKSAYDTHILEKCEKIPSVKLKRLRSTVESGNTFK